MRGRSEGPPSGGIQAVRSSVPNVGGLVAQFAEAEVGRNVERLFFIEVVSFDWNCPQYITPRYTADEIEEAVAPLKKRIAELEAQLKARS